MFGDVMNVIAVVASFAALTVSAWLAIRQLRYARHANHLPFAAEMLREFRDPTFIRAQCYIEQELAKDCDPSLGISGLPLEAKEKVTHVASFYQSVAALAVFDIVDREKIVFMLGRRALCSWNFLAPYIQAERSTLSPGATLYSLFEDLAARAAVSNNSEMVRRLDLQSVQ
jgi:hypothetical protein